MQLLTLKYLPNADNTAMYLGYLKCLKLLNISSLVGKGNSTRSEADYLFANPIKQLSFSDSLSNQDCETVSNDIKNLPSFAVGHLNYPSDEGLQSLTKLSYCTINLYNWQIKIDNTKQSVNLQVLTPNQETESLYQKLCAITETFKFTNSACHLSKPFKPAITKYAYQKAFERIQEHIQSGDVYQINLTQAFQAEFEGEALDVFTHILQSVEAPYCAYLERGEQTICSFSPEEFISIEDGEIKTSPIKGTIARSKTPNEDIERIQQLNNSEKDRAEHIMIVDLLRNDLGKICKSGSIKVDKLLNLETFATVHHLVSTISGRLKAGISPLEALVSCFPGGSITGAPKIKAMEIIHQLETYNRQVYCGSIFYIAPDERLISNIPIRTIVAEGNRLTCWSGGGIVADSNSESEYQEAIDKINHLFKALEIRSDSNE